MTLIKLAGIAVLIVIGGIHWAISYARPRAMGWIVPVLYIGLVAVFAYRGAMTSWLDWVMSAVGLAVLVGVWFKARGQKRKTEMDRIDNTLSTTA